MKKYFSYDLSNPQPVAGELHRIVNGQIRLEKCIFLFSFKKHLICLIIALNAVYLGKESLVLKAHYLVLVLLSLEYLTGKA